MKNTGNTLSLEHLYDNVNTISSGDEFSSSDSMIHHKDLKPEIQKERIIYRGYREKGYGVSSSHRLFSPQMFVKKFDYIRDCLRYCLGLSVAQREIALRLLRYWAYYGYVYPKAAQVCSDPGCSKATYWRTVRLLQDEGLITVVNRFVIRPHAQISNLYRLDRLVQLIARYLAEHIAHVWPDWFDSILHLTWFEFWNIITPKSLYLTDS